MIEKVDNEYYLLYEDQFTKKGGIPHANKSFYHGFGVRGYDYVKSKYESGAVTFTLEPKAIELNQPLATACYMKEGHL